MAYGDPQEAFLKRTIDKEIIDKVDITDDLVIHWSGPFPLPVKAIRNFISTISNDQKMYESFINFYQ